MKKFLILLISFIFISCWIEPKDGKWEQKDKIYYFEDFETMNVILRPEINKTFPQWHWNNEDFEKKYNQYLNNIKVSTEYSSYLKKIGYQFVVFLGPLNEKIQCYNANDVRVYLNGKYYIIIRDNGDAVTFFENNGDKVKENDPETEFPFKLQ